jgi:hypothetical protein
VPDPFRQRGYEPEKTHHAGTADRNQFLREACLPAADHQRRSSDASQRERDGVAGECERGQRQGQREGRSGDEHG